MKDLNIIVGQKIQNRLDTLGMSQTDLAEKLNTSRQIINKIIHGRKNITLEEAKVICKVLDLKVDELMDVSDSTELDAQDPMIAFMGEVSSQEAKEGLARAKKVMDLIIFHRDLHEEYKNILND